MFAIENIKAGDKVISTNPETFETAEKTVVETYIREDNKLIHLVINGEEIVTTETHPFYVNNRGFVNAGELKVGDELLDPNGNIVLIECYDVELTDKPVTVYNFDEYRVYQQIEMNAFADVWYPDKGQEYADLGKLKAKIQPALDRYDVREAEKQDMFKSILARFNRIYSFITQACRLFDKG